MQTLLELSSYTSYQASCLTPVLWALLAGMIICGVSGLYADWVERRTNPGRHTYRPRRNQHKRR